EHGAGGPGADPRRRRPQTPFRRSRRHSHAHAAGAAPLKEKTMQGNYRIFALGALWTFAALLPLTARAQPVDLGKSAVTATFMQMGVPVAAKFTRLDAQVNYDGKAPERTTAAMQVDVASFDLGDPEYNAEVRKPEWFDAGKYAKATFATQCVRVLAPD